MPTFLAPVEKLRNDRDKPVLRHLALLGVQQQLRFTLAASVFVPAH
jgi:hypothetical protein